MLIIGTTSSDITVEERLRWYEDPANDMLDDGFTVNSPEYLEALIAMSQSPAPRGVWVGVRDDTTSPVESCLEAVTACREKNPNWYIALVCDSAKADHLAIAEYIESVSPASIYAFTTADADVLTGASGNIFSALKALEYKRTIGQYSTESPYAIAGIMGYAMGQNSGLANSAFTLKFKSEVGVEVEDLSASVRDIIKGNNGNLYLNYGNSYNMFEEGVMSNGQFFDQIINLDMLVNDIQLSCMDLLSRNPKIPQTEGGVSQLIHVVSIACESAVLRGYLGAGKWTGQNILALKTDDTLPSGYLIQAAKLFNQTTADREARKAPSMYVAIKEAGAVHSILIGVYVNS
jgi:hypothetical protein